MYNCTNKSLYSLTNFFYEPYSIPLFYYKSIKPLSNCSNIDSYLNQFNKFNNFCNRIKKIKSKIRAARYKANIISIGNHFLKKEYRLGWRDLKKLAKPSYSKTPSHVIKSKFGNDIVSPREQISRWAEHYKRSCF